MDTNLKARFLGLYCMVVADGIVEAKEMQTLYQIGKQQFNLSDEDINKIVINAGPSTPELNTPQEKVAFLYQLAQIAAADGEIDETEVLLLEKYAHHYDFQEENIPKISKHLFDKALKGVSEAEVLTEIFN